jgi:hypothetical protein
MVMRYYWGLAIGHTYSHFQPATTAASAVPTQGPHSTMASGLEAETERDLVHTNYVYEPDVDDPELSLENREDDLGEWDEGFGSEDEFAEDGEGDDEQLVAMYDMYGPSNFDGF